MRKHDVAEVPGPIYDVNHEPTFKAFPQYSFGYASPQENDNVLTNVTATPINVGPGKYENNYKALSHQRTDPKVSFTKSGRMSLCNTKNYLNETYETYSSIGKQQRSKMKNANGTKFDKSKKHRKTFIAKRDMAVKPVRIRLPHAHY